MVKLSDVPSVTTLREACAEMRPLVHYFADAVSSETSCLQHLKDAEARASAAVLRYQHAIRQTAENADDFDSRILSDCVRAEAQLATNDYAIDIILHQRAKLQFKGRLTHAQEHHEAAPAAKYDSFSPEKESDFHQNDILDTSVIGDSPLRTGGPQEMQDDHDLEDAQESIEVVQVDDICLLDDKIENRSLSTEVEGMSVGNVAQKVLIFEVEKETEAVARTYDVQVAEPMKHAALPTERNMLESLDATEDPEVPPDAANAPAKVSFSDDVKLIEPISWTEDARVIEPQGRNSKNGGAGAFRCTAIFLALTATLVLLAAVIDLLAVLTGKPTRLVPSSWGVRDNQICRQAPWPKASDISYSDQDPVLNSKEAHADLSDVDLPPTQSTTVEFVHSTEL